MSGCDIQTSSSAAGDGIGVFDKGRPAALQTSRSRFALLNFFLSLSTSCFKLEEELNFRFFLSSLDQQEAVLVWFSVGLKRIQSLSNPSPNRVVEANTREYHWILIKGINAKSENLQRKRKVEGRGRGRERKRKGKGERDPEIGSEALAETEKIANAPAGNRTRDPQQTRLMLYH